MNANNNMLQHFADNENQRNLSVVFWSVSASILKLKIGKIVVKCWTSR